MFTNNKWQRARCCFLARKLHLRAVKVNMPTAKVTTDTDSKMHTQTPWKQTCPLPRGTIRETFTRTKYSISQKAPLFHNTLPDNPTHYNAAGHCVMCHFNHNWHRVWRVLNQRCGNCSVGIYRKMRLEYWTQTGERNIRDTQSRTIINTSCIKTSGTNLMCQRFATFSGSWRKIAQLVKLVFNIELLKQKAVISISI